MAGYGRGWGGGWDGEFPEYVPAAERRRRALVAAQKLAGKGHKLSPVVIEGRAIATSFWGKAWCQNLESYSDFANRLPRGRTYARNGSVIDLQAKAGRVDARVSGTELYTVRVDVKPVPRARWDKIVRACAGKVDSLVELLQGRLSDAVMAVTTRKHEGLFPEPRELEFECSCPDYADMCKHVAAVLYGLGARLDKEPELLFRLRGVDPVELVSAASGAHGVAGKAGKASGKALATQDMGALFGIELEGATQGGTRAGAKGTSAVRKGAPVVPTGKAVVPAGTRVVPKAASAVSKAASVVPKAASVVPKAASAVPKGGPVVPKGGPVVPTGKAVVPTGRRAVPAGRRAVPKGKRAVPTGKRAVPTGKAVVPTGKRAVPTGTPVVPKGTRAVAAKRSNGTVRAKR